MHWTTSGIEIPDRPMKLHDTHAHLLFDVLASQLDDVMTRAMEAGVRRITVPALGPGVEELDLALRLVDTHPGCSFIAGIHPHKAKAAEAAFYDRMGACADRMAAVGEIGLDYHYNFSSPEEQKAVFTVQLDLARSLGLPVVLHVREAHGDTLDILAAHPARENSIVHCFTGDERDAVRYLDLGFFISFSGIVTFPRAEEVRRAARMVPADRILVETDAPYLAPRSRRGRTCEPAMVRETLMDLADLRGEDPEELAAATWRNGGLTLANRVGGLELAGLSTGGGGR